MEGILPVGRVRASLALPFETREWVPALPGLRAPEPEAGSDLATFRAMLAGTMPIARGMELIAASGGWPIRTQRGFIVAAAHPGPISLAGDHNGWRPQPMQHRGELYWSHIAAPTGDGSGKYKLVIAGATVADENARCYGYDEYGEHSLLAAKGAHLERWVLGGRGIAARPLRVWVPAETPTHHLYVHDGQNLFAPSAPHGGWKLHESAGPRTLVIGIDHGADRFGELTPWTDTAANGKPLGGNGAAYADFVENVVRPHIEARYGPPKRVGVMGSSLGGLMALYQARRFPGRYDFAASMSGTVGWGNESGNETLIDAFETGPRVPAHLYLDWGGSRGGSDNYDDNVRLLGVLRSRHYEHVTHFHEPGGLHQEDAWAARVWRPLGVFEAL